MTNFLLLIATVLIGYVFVLVFKPTKQKNLKLLLAFSGAFLLSITVFNFLPEVFTNNNNKTIGLFIMAGILLQIILEFFSKGAEHGHVHLSENSSAFPWLLFISLSIHSVLEGIPIEAHDNLIYGVIIHKLPVCTHDEKGEKCGKLALYPQRLDEDGIFSSYEAPTIVVGGVNKYFPRCNKHFVKPLPETLK